MQINDASNKDNESLSFTGIVTIWILLSLLGVSFFYFLIELTFPFSTPGYSYLQLFIIRILFLSAFPIGTLGLVTPFLPYQTIDYSRSAIIKSLEHKLLFLCTSPILYLGYQVANKVGSLTDSLIEPGVGFFSTGLVISMTILGWLYISLRCWEFLSGKDASITLQNLRIERKNNRFHSPSNISQVSFQPRYEKRHQSLVGKVSLRYISFMCGLPILLLMTGEVLDPNLSFVFGLFSGLSLNLFACFFSLLFFKNYLVREGVSLEFVNHINIYVFGKEDIKPYFFIIGLFSLFLMFIYVSGFHYFIPKEIIILIYFLLVLIFISIVWSNQVNALYNHLLPKRFRKDNSPRRIILRENK